MYQEVKTTKEGKCSKCGRDIKRGWTAYYDGHSLYCRPCGMQLIVKQGQSKTKDTEPTSNISHSDIYNNIGALAEALGMLRMKIDVLADDVRKLAASLEDFKVDHKLFEKEVIKCNNK